ncbi:Sepiapterin reductase [Diplonema papillatum]|nr:Sepiapterin reductase [Diplonema papillatum]|eukprot:gene18652-28787_t
MSRLAVVTGANRGFGKCVAVELARNAFVNEFLLSHRGSGAAGAQDSVKEVKAAASAALCRTVELDMSDLNSVVSSLTAALAPFADSDFAEVILINNAGSIGTLQPCALIPSSEAVENVNANVSACMLVTNAFLSFFSPLKTSGKVSKLAVVNVSSLLALQPMKGFSLYCSAKAARDMYMRCAALEFPDVRFLNYAPGPMDTAMHAEIRSGHADAEVKKQFCGMKGSGSLVDPSASAAVLARLLRNNAFENGGHVDYYDVKDEAD